MRSASPRFSTVDQYQPPGIVWWMIAAASMAGAGKGLGAGKAFGANSSPFF